MASGYSFGAPKPTGSTGASTGSLFGNSPATAGGSLFSGTPATTSSGSAGGIFSFANTSSNTTNNQSTPSLFGNTTTANTGSIFGQQPGSGAGSAQAFAFAKPIEANESGEISKSVFSSSSQATPVAPATPSTGAGTQGGALFGASTGASSGSLFSSTPAPAKYSFGGSTTPAGPPPAPSIFGGSTGGNTATTQGQANTSGGGGLFGALQPGTSGSSQNHSWKGFAANSTGSLFNPVANNGPDKSSKLFSTAPPPVSVSSVAEETAPPTSKPGISFPSIPPTSGADASKGLFGGSGSTAQSTTSGAGANQPKLSFGPTADSSVAASAPPSLSFPPDSNSQDTAKATSGFSFPSSTTSQEALKPTPAFSFPQSTAASSCTTATTGPATPGLFSGLGSQTSTSGPQSQSQSQPGALTNPPPATLASTTYNGAERSGPTLGTSTSGPAPTSQSRLRNKTMDEILTRWASDLTKYTKEFRSHAETIAHWDQVLVDNMSKISNLYSQTFTAEKQTDSVDMQLTAVENQQNELDYWMSNYEKIVDDMLEKNAGNVTELGGPDQERERTYKLAEKLGEKLEDMGRDLEVMVEEINAANAGLSAGKKGDEPITQIVRILNSHLTQLQAIDQGTVALQAKVAAAQKNAGSLGYSNGDNGGTSGVAVDDFYRSYMGRRS